MHPVASCVYLGVTYWLAGRLNPLTPEYICVRCEWDEKAGGAWHGAEKVWEYILPPPPEEWIEAKPEDPLPEPLVLRDKLVALDDTVATCMLPIIFCYFAFAQRLLRG